ncbi:alpha/beta hydrolase [Cryptosporangium phraense]|uniref:Alpha/beta hydrolase n=1 Tax=Cryptosporangium phraense TaxID=2593070 RepID=A0A545ANU6_9ACTN|nr:alpha/beta hydrolase [Cryptosporangium phraense]TQS43009.1 alpha/beta hydrolase [Cryptosporangium phraense]
MNPPPFDPELGAFLDTIAHLMGPPPTREQLPAAREPSPLQPRPTDDELSRGGRFRISEDGPLLSCLPADATGPVPVLYWIHGGGMILGDNRSGGLTQILDLVVDLPAAVVAVNYGLAPEHPHPEPVEDCYAGLQRVAELGLGPLIVAGRSAGGGLAAATVLLARDRGGPAIHAQMLLAPMLDDRNDSFSARQLDGRGIWDRSANAFGWGCLLGDAAGGPDVSPYAAPARATDLSGLPPAYLDVGSAETFRDEDVAYANAIWQAGGDAELHVWPGGFHGFDGFVPESRLARRAWATRRDWLTGVLGR